MKNLTNKIRFVPTRIEYLVWAKVEKQVRLCPPSNKIWKLCDIIYQEIQKIIIWELPK